MRGSAPKKMIMLLLMIMMAMLAMIGTPVHQKAWHLKKQISNRCAEHYCTDGDTHPAS